MKPIIGRAEEVLFVLSVNIPSLERYKAVNISARVLSKRIWQIDFFLNLFCSYTIGWCSCHSVADLLPI